jgi:hypothetical protein
MYNINNTRKEFSEEFNGHYMKMKDVEQNDSATKFAVCYNIDGVFMLRTFGRDNRTQEEIKDSDINLNDLLGIDDWTMAI